MIANFYGGMYIGGREYSNDTYLILEDFNRAVFIFYDVPNKLKFKTEGKFIIIPVALQVSETLARSGMAVYGIAFTSETLDDTWHNDHIFTWMRAVIEKDWKLVAHLLVAAVDFKCKDNTDSFDKSEKHQIQHHEILKEWGKILY